MTGLARNLAPERIVSRTVVLNDLSPREVAMLFANMDSEDQARFFTELADITSAWPGLGWCGQCAYIADSLGPNGRGVIETLAGHLEKQA